VLSKALNTVLFRLQGLPGGSEEAFAIYDTIDGDVRIETQFAGSGKYRPIVIRNGDDGSDLVTIAVFDPTQKALFLGSKTNVPGAFGTVARFQNNTNSPIATSRFAADVFGARMDFLKSRSATIGGHTIVQNGDSMGDIIWAGSDGDQFIPGATISAVVDGTPGNNDMPTSLVFYTTADGASGVTERLRIRPDGELQFPAAAFAANNATAATLSVLPAGAATAASNKWLRIRDNAGVDSYIPVWQ
jgi:hypothetical protein